MKGRGIRAETIEGGEDRISRLSNQKSLKRTEEEQELREDERRLINVGSLVDPKWEEKMGGTG